MITYISYLTNLYGHEINNNNNNNEKETNKNNNNNNKNRKINNENAGKQDLITNSPLKQNRCSGEQFRYKPLFFFVSEEKRGSPGLNVLQATELPG